MTAPALQSARDIYLRIVANIERVMRGLKEEGCDAAALACTEIPLIVRPEIAPLPVLDSTRLLAGAAVRRALEP